VARDWRDERIAELEHEVELLRAENAELRRQVAELKELVQRNSQNSSTPPSKDVRKPKRKRAKTGRKRGAQPGHAKHERPLVPVEQVDKLVEVHPRSCEHCGGAVHDDGKEPERHQVFELPEVKPHVTEYRLHSGCCERCGQATRASLPPGVPNSAFGASVLAVLGVLIGRCRLSKRAASEALQSLFGLSISVGAVVGCQNRLSAALAAPVAEASDHVQQHAIKNADETSWRQCNQRAWLWVTLSGMVVVFMVHARRSAAAATQLLGEVRGVLGTDRYSGYSHWPARLHQVCWSHLKRDFTAISERQGEAGRIGRALLEQEKLLFGEWHRFRAGSLSRKTLQQRVRPIQREVLDLLVRGVHCGHAKTAGTCDKMLGAFDSFWTFVRIEGVEPTNNASERAIRHGVLYRHISLGTQSERGSRFVERILTVEASLRRQGRDMRRFLLDACHAQLRGTAPPSLIPCEVHGESAILQAA
jgi:transposase